MHPLLETPCVDGFGETECSSWSEFTERTQNDELTTRFVFRGQPSSHFKLETSLVRKCQQLGLDPDTPLRKKHLENFKMAIRGRVGLSDSILQQDEEIWAIGQHYGLATPLLDWTESLYVAVYFAFLNEFPPSTRPMTRSVYALDEELIHQDFLSEVEQQLQKLHPDVYSELDSAGDELFSVTADGPKIGKHAVGIASGSIPSDLRTRNACRFSMQAAECHCIRIIKPSCGENSRLVVQRGLFSMSVLMAPIESQIKARFAGTGKKVLIKINMPHDRRDVLNKLNQMNINHLSLFPDLTGSSVHCNSLLPSFGAPFDHS